MVEFTWPPRFRDEKKSVTLIESPGLRNGKTHRFQPFMNTSFPSKYSPPNGSDSSTRLALQKLRKHPGRFESWENAIAKRNSSETWEASYELSCRNSLEIQHVYLYIYTHIKFLDIIDIDINIAYRPQNSRKCLWSWSCIPLPNRKMKRTSTFPGYSSFIQWKKHVQNMSGWVSSPIPPNGSCRNSFSGRSAGTPRNVAWPFGPFNRKSMVRTASKTRCRFTRNPRVTEVRSPEFKGLFWWWVSVSKKVIWGPSKKIRSFFQHQFQNKKDNLYSETNLKRPEFQKRSFRKLP